MAYFDQKMKSEVLRRLASFQETKFSVKVERNSLLRICVKSSKMDFIKVLVSYYESIGDYEEAYIIEKYRFFDFSYISDSFIERLKGYNVEIANFLSNVVSVAKLYGHPTYEHYVDNQPYSDTCNVAYFIRLSLGDKSKNEGVRLTKVKNGK